MCRPFSTKGIHHLLLQWTHSMHQEKPSIFHYLENSRLRLNFSFNKHLNPYCVLSPVLGTQGTRSLRFWYSIAAAEIDRCRAGFPGMWPVQAGRDRSQAGSTPSWSRLEILQFLNKGSIILFCTRLISYVACLAWVLPFWHRGNNKNYINIIFSYSVKTSHKVK